LKFETRDLVRFKVFEVEETESKSQCEVRNRKIVGEKPPPWSEYGGEKAIGGGVRMGFE